MVTSGAMSCGTPAAPARRAPQHNASGGGTLMPRRNNAPLETSASRAALGAVASASSQRTRSTVEHMVTVFAEVWRVLRRDGTLWLNLGDSYANDGKWGGRDGWEARRSAPRRTRGTRQAEHGPQAERPLRHPLARCLRAAGVGVVAAAGHRLVEAEPDAGKRHRPAYDGA